MFHSFHSALYSQISRNIYIYIYIYNDPTTGVPYLPKPRSYILTGCHFLGFANPQNPNRFSYLVM